VDRAPGRHVAGGLSGQPAVLLGAEQQDVGQRRFDGVTGAARALGAAPLLRPRGGVRSRRAQLAQVGRVDRQLAGEGTAQRLVGRDQGPQPLVDLAVHALTLLLNALLDGLHHQHADADADQRKHREAHQRGEHALPRTEIHIAHRNLEQRCRRIPV
jgi:hypothetical protein